MFKKNKPKNACSQCGRPAVVQYGDALLCVDCNLKFQQAQQLEYIRRISEYNFYVQQVELGTMLPLGTLGRVPVPTPPFQGDTLTLNHINVDRSTIGAINTGNIKRLDVAITQMESQGDTEIGQALAEMTQAVIETPDLSELRKNELLEHLSFLAEQPTLPKQQRTQNITGVVLNAVDGLILETPSLKQTWERFKSALRKELKM